MMTTASNYMYGQGSEFEYRRLLRQGALFEKITRSVFEQAGIGPGMQVLDVGCGSGDVARIAAEFVGDSGRVVAIDMDPQALEVARRHVARNNVEFVHTAVDDFTAARPFDAVVGRFILMHLKDPVAALRHVAAQVRPGGIVCFIDGWHGISMSQPRVEAFQQFMAGATQALRGAGAHLDMGARLYGDFLAAGLPAPKTFATARLFGSGDTENFDLMIDSARSGIRAMVPEAQREAVLGQVEELDRRMREEAAEKRATMLMMITVGAWTTLPTR